MKSKIAAISIFLNVVLLSVVIIQEHYGHAIGMALERRGWVTLDKKAHPEYVVRKSWTSSIRNMHTNFDVVFFGNSITCGGDFQKYFPEKKVINLGISGDNLVGMKQRIPMLKAANPSKCFIMAGANDLHHLSMSQFKERYSSLISAIRDSLPHTQLYLESILPMNKDINSKVPSDEKIREANLFIEKTATSDGLEGVFVDLYSLYVKDRKLPEEMTRDGLHLIPEYYGIWGEAIYEYIME